LDLSSDRILNEKLNSCETFHKNFVVTHFIKICSAVPYIVSFVQRDEQRVNRHST